MRNTNSTGVVGATRFLFLLAAAAMCVMGVSQSAGAQAQVDAPTVSIDDVSISGTVCPDPATLTVRYSAQASLSDLERVEITLRSDVNPSGFTEEVTLEEASPSIESAASFTIPADTPTSTWIVTVTAVDIAGQMATATASIDAVAEPGCAVAPGDPNIEIAAVSAAGPLCPEGTVVNANIVLRGLSGEVTLTGKIEGPDEYSLAADPVTVEVNSDEETIAWSIDLPVDAPDGQLSLMVSAEGTSWGSATATSFMVERDVDACTGDPGVTMKIDSIAVCPSTHTVTAIVTATAVDGLKSVVGSSDLFGAPQPAAIVEGETAVTKSLAFAIPTGAKPGTYQLVAEAIDVSGNASVDYRDFTLGAVDDCRPIDPGGIDPSGPGGTIIIDPPKPVEPIDYWDYDDDQVPNAFTAAPFAPASLRAEPTHEPTKPAEQPGTGHKPGALAYTGSRTENVAVAGVMLIVAGVTVLYGRRPKHAD